MSCQRCHQELNRREFLKFALSIALTVPPIGSVIDRLAKIMTVPGLIGAKSEGFDPATWRSLVSLEFGVQLYAGKTNILRATTGRQPAVSAYLRSAAANIVGGLPGGASEITTAPADDPTWLPNPSSSHLLLGGPLANEATQKLGSYELRTNQVGPEIPMFDTLSNLRWGYYLGDPVRGYGSFAGERPVLVRRSDDEGNLCERPLYGMYDLLDSSEPAPFAYDSNGFLIEEALLIQRVGVSRGPLALEAGRTYTMVSGVHGYSTVAFAAELDVNLERVRDMVGGRLEYQIRVPARLTHSESGGQWETTAALDWERAERFLPV